MSKPKGRVSVKRDQQKGAAGRTLAADGRSRATVPHLSESSSTLRPACATYRVGAESGAKLSPSGARGRRRCVAGCDTPGRHDVCRRGGRRLWTRAEEAVLRARYPHERTATIADVSRVIVDSAKVEVNFLKVTGALHSTGFLPDADEEQPKPQLAAGGRGR